jgi:hypothetical protein
LPALSNQKQGEIAKGTKRMDLRGYFEKIKEFEAKTKDAFAVIVSLESPDGGRAGILTEVSRSLAAKMVVEGLARLANAEEKRSFDKQRTATPPATS